ncbi:lipoprotein-releasing system ATP-binding protein [Oceanospirillum multiglobuliferum]|uniref:Lipoprotein-releasing system ATP-binding protein LolD n=1 Tax=Oceanospirillum multiglobuliferum TaxID=64969 RepID=A0A1T4R3X0_9GAMM|nr:lipoprotein-releasing ABC transporter ATP-binding protein LolD [Oceanospirillum multiglobuliferum]OPX55245.1 lipoprotein releasing system, ATP-binding protein [Oceanospirillum multiglobuliferum]SKA10744.1 lipoprotein-releasing system ATP-binding protein [Oceanospirillum multiglobuliferum]
MNKSTSIHTSHAPALQCVALNMIFSEGPEQIQVLNNLEFTAFHGERVAIVGSSGSGKTTLLHLLGGLDKPTSGQVLIAGQDLVQMTDAELGKFRNRSLGFVYQLHHLLPEFTALENVLMPLLIRGEKRKNIIPKATALLERVGLGHRMQHKPAELSGGERQRVAIARALVGNPSCVLLDEPTGNLDPNTAESVNQLMLEIGQEHNTCFITVTHDMALAQRMDRVLRLEYGQLTEVK